MYEAFYKLKSKPFQLSPDPSFFFSSKGHGRALDYLLYGLHQGEGFIVITGEIGAGKTMLARKLARQLQSQNYVMAHVVNTRLDADDVVRTVASAFELEPQANKAANLRSLEQFLVACQKQKRRALLLVDEAQNLPLASVEELRMLSNFMRDDKPLLQIFMLGQPELRDMIADASLEQLRQRIIATCHLGALNADETEAYVMHRLQTAGWTGDPFIEPEAFAAIHGHTEGIPRKINLLCDRLMLVGMMDDKHAFGAAEVQQVIDDLESEFTAAAGKRDSAAQSRARRADEGA